MHLLTFIRERHNILHQAVSVQFYEGCLRTFLTTLVQAERNRNCPGSDIKLKACAKAISWSVRSELMRISLVWNCCTTLILWVIENMTVSTSTVVRTINILNVITVTNVKTVTNMKKISAKCRMLCQTWKGVTNVKSYTVTNEKCKCVSPFGVTHGVT